jgi:hypothetical protein
MKGANLRYADLSDANLAGTDLTNADLENANLEGTILDLAVSSQVNTQNLTACDLNNNLYIRSATELRIAQALDRAGVLFYLNGRTCLNSTEQREVKESDFLVLYGGRWGILEVKGEPLHSLPYTRQRSERVFAVSSQELLKASSIHLVERYDPTRCREQPDRVVEEFLELLSKT